MSNGTYSTSVICSYGKEGMPQEQGKKEQKVEGTILLQHTQTCSVTRLDRLLSCNPAIEDSQTSDARVVEVVDRLTDLAAVRMHKESPPQHRCIFSNSPLFKTHPRNFRIFRKLLHIRAFQPLGSPNMLFLEF